MASDYRIARALRRQAEQAGEVAPASLRRSTGARYTPAPPGATTFVVRMLGAFGKAKKNSPRRIRLGEDSIGERAALSLKAAKDGAIPHARVGLVFGAKDVIHAFYGDAWTVREGQLLFSTRSVSVPIRDALTWNGSDYAELILRRTARPVAVVYRPGGEKMAREMADQWGVCTMPL